MLKSATKIPEFLVAQDLAELKERHPYWPALGDNDKEKFSTRLEGNAACYMLYSKTNSIAVKIVDPSLFRKKHHVENRHVEILKEMAEKGSEEAARLIRCLSLKRFLDLALPLETKTKLQSPYKVDPIPHRERAQLQGLLDNWIAKSAQSEEQTKFRTQVRNDLLFAFDTKQTRIILDGKMTGSLPPGLHLLNSVRIVRLEQFDFENISSDFTFPPRLQILKIKECQSPFPNEILPKTLTDLSLENNKKSLGIDIYRLENLRILSLGRVLSDQDCIGLDTRVGNLKKLQKLSVKEKEGKFLSNDVMGTLSNLPELSQLELEICYGADFPIIYKLQHLRDFVVSLVLEPSSKEYAARSEEWKRYYSGDKTKSTKPGFGRLPSSFISNLKQMPGLCTLVIEDIWETDPALAELGTLHQLRSLGLSANMLHSLPATLLSYLANVRLMYGTIT